MTTVVRHALVRHGRASAGWNVDPDPGLDELGRSQAELVADALVDWGNAELVSSPLRRCRETVAPLAARLGRTPRLEPRVAEIPSPEGVAMADRVDWLRAAMAGTWSALGPRYTAYRDGVVAAIAELNVPSIVVSHFVAINAVIGAASDDDRVLIRSLDNCSITVVEVADGIVRLVTGGHEADTLIR